MVMELVHLARRGALIGVSSMRIFCENWPLYARVWLRSMRRAVCVCICIKLKLSTIQPNHWPLVVS